MGSIFGQPNGVKIHKIRWLGNVSVDKEYRLMVVYLDTKEEADRLRLDTSSCPCI